MLKVFKELLHSLTYRNSCNLAISTFPADWVICDWHVMSCHKHRNDNNIPTRYIHDCEVYSYLYLKLSHSYMVNSTENGVLLD